jgi:hypothetical protein
LGIGLVKGLFWVRVRIGVRWVRVRKFDTEIVFRNTIGNDQKPSRPDEKARIEVS